MALDDRKSAILRAVVQQYIETAQPVGSTSIANRPDVAVSSATVRNELHNLEADGYLAQPHTSAGRIPTQKGYRFFVDSMTGKEALSPVTMARVSDFFDAAHGELEQMLRATSSLLSGLTGSAAVVTGEPGEAVTIRSIQLIDLHPETLMVVLVTSNGSVFKRTFETPAGLQLETEMPAAHAVLSEDLVGQPLSALARWTPSANRQGAILAEAATAAACLAADESGAQVYVDGASSLADSFDAKETIRSVLTVLEKQFVVVSLLKELVDGGMNVAIGSETGVATLAECSLVVAPYHSDGGQVGAIAVLGPTRMNYARTVSAVNEVSRQLSGLLSDA